MDVQIVQFPETKVAALEYQGSPEREYEAIRNLIQWRIENKIPPSPKHRNYGLHYNDSRKVAPADYRIDLCISVERDVQPNSYGIVNKIIPACRCAKATHFGSRENITAAVYIYEKWLPESAEQAADLPIIFHYVNVGPQIQESEMITDVYFPLA